MVALGDLYANGQGVPQDRVQALTWYKLSSLYGQPEGGKRGEALAAAMTPEEQADAKRRTESWVPTGDQAGGDQPAAAAETAIPMHTPELPAVAGASATPEAVPAAVPEAAPVAAAPEVPAVVAPSEPAAPAPLPASTPTALQWVTPPEPAPAPIPEPVAAPAAAVPEPAPAQPAPAQPAPVQPASTPTANDNPINPATNEPYAPFDPFAPDPFSLEGLTPNVPGAQQGSKSYVPPADPQP